MDKADRDAYKEIAEVFVALNLLDILPPEAYASRVQFVVRAQCAELLKLSEATLPIVTSHFSREGIQKKHDWAEGTYCDEVTVTTEVYLELLKIALGERVLEEKEARNG